MAVFYRKDIEKKSNGYHEKPRETTVTPSQKREELSEEVLSDISNREFLRIQRNERLKHITHPSKDSESIKIGDDITFKFKFGEKLNTDLYLKTTIGQVMPSSVREVAAYGTTWVRTGSEGEFYTQAGQRLIIKDGSMVSIKKILSPEELSEENKKIIAEVNEYKGDQNYDTILEGTKRALPISVIQSLIIPQIKETDEIRRKVQIEEVLTEFERTKDYYSDDFGSNSIVSGNTLSASFLAYYINQNHIQGTEKDNVIKELGINQEDIEKYSRMKRSLVFRGFRGMTELSDEEKKNLSDVPTDLMGKWENEQFGLRIVPGSKEAMQLFTLAGLRMVPSLSIEEAKRWGTSESLHYILNRESSGIVGQVNKGPNGLLGKGIDGSQMKERALKRTDLRGDQLASKEFDVVSTAVGLGQLVMMNEKYMPNGRASIGIPLEEAIGMLQYIRDRYGDPDEARRLYGKTGKCRKGWTKTFEEGY